MCLTPLKSSLNPNAQEWRPPTIATAAAFLPHKRLPLPQIPHHNPYCSSNGFFPYAERTHLVTYYPTVAVPPPPPPPYGCLYRAIRVAKPFCGGNDFSGEERESSEEKLGAPKINGRFRRVFPLPPRLRTVRYFNSSARKPCPKKEWRPVKPSPVSREVYGGGNGFPASSADEVSDASNTTVMIRNIPNKLRRDFFLKFLDDHCKAHSLEYDFLYLPMDFRIAAALQFKKILGNYKWQMVYTERGPIASKKVCEVTWARIQGKDALIRRFKNSTFPCDNMEFLPVVLDPPRNGSDPDPSPPQVLGILHPRNYHRAQDLVSY